MTVPYDPDDDPLENLQMTLTVDDLPPVGAMCRARSNGQRDVIIDVTRRGRRSWVTLRNTRSATGATKQRLDIFLEYWEVL